MVAEPIADTQWGIADWTDYENNWRAGDADYLQSRAIARFHTAADRTAALGSGPVGMVTYNETTDRIEWRSKLGPWVPITPMPLYMVATQDTSAAVSLAHVSAAGKGVTFTPTDIRITGPLNVLTDVVEVTTVGISIKTGARKATLSTDATHVVGDTPFKLPSMVLTGTGTVIDATGKTIVAGTVTSTLLSTQNMNLSGTLSGGIINGASGTIGGVKLGITANVAEAPAGFLSQGATFVGDGSKGILGYTAKQGKVHVDDRVGLLGLGVDLNADMAVRNKAIAWYDITNALKGYYAVSVYSATDPGAANFPEGTIWFS
jgi:hypothetical protein